MKKAIIIATVLFHLLGLLFPLKTQLFSAEVVVSDEVITKKVQIDGIETEKVVAEKVVNQNVDEEGEEEESEEGEAVAEKTAKKKAPVKEKEPEPAASVCGRRFGPTRTTISAALAVGLAATAALIVVSNDSGAIHH